MVGEHCLAINTARMVTSGCRYGSRLCNMCSIYVIEDVPHLLFVCTSAASLRAQFWKAMGDGAPSAFVREMTRMSPIELTEFCLSGFNVSYTSEWEDIYSLVCRYIHAVYAGRSEL